MVKHQTRKMRSHTKKVHGPKAAPKAGLKKLRAAFDSMEQFVDKLGPKVKHSFSDAVSAYKEEWRRVFKRDISPADAAAYLKFRFNLKGKSAMTRRSKMRGGAFAATPIAGAPLEYQMRAGVNGVYGNFPSYQQEGLDRYYGSAISADCGKPNGFPTDGSAASQAGGGASMDALFRPLQSSPTNMAYTTMMEHKGVPAYPTSDPVSSGAIRPQAASYITNANMSSWGRSAVGDIMKK
jgi:hypothetical protein